MSKHQKHRKRKKTKTKQSPMYAQTPSFPFTPCLLFSLWGKQERGESLVGHTQLRRGLCDGGGLWPERRQSSAGAGGEDQDSGVQMPGREPCLKQL